MKKTRLTLLLIFSLVFCNCSKDNIELPVITPANLLRNEISLFDIAENIVYIPLDQGIILSSILDVKKSNMGFYIKTSEGLFHYDNQGRYKFQIGRKGKGPEEYTFVKDFEIVQQKQQIFILCDTKVKIFNFNGDYLRSFDTPNKNRYNELEIIQNMIVFPEGIGLSKLENEWYLCDLEGKVMMQKNNSLKYQERRVSYKANLVFEDGNRMFYWNQLNDTIFHVGKQAVPYYLFGIDKFRLSSFDLSSSDNFRKKESWQLISVLASERYLFLEYLLLKEMKRVITVYDKNNKKHYELNRTDLSNTSNQLNAYDNGPAFVPRSKVVYNDQDYLVSWINAIELKSLIESELFNKSIPRHQEMKSAIKELGMALSENDNPVLVLVTFK